MKLSAVLLEYHSIDEISTAVASIRKYDKNCEIVVSSNSLYDTGERKKAVESIPDVKWVFNKENGGFGYGMSMGAKEASGEYVVFLNSDVVLLDDFEKMRKKIRTEEVEYREGIVEIKVTFLDEKSSK